MIGLALSIYMLISSGGLVVQGRTPTVHTSSKSNAFETPPASLHRLSITDGSKVAAGVSIVMQSASSEITGDIPESHVEMTLDERRFIDLTNAERARAGCSRLTVDKTLIQTARAHSREMYEKNYFSHESPTASLRTPMTRFLAQTRRIPTYAMVGENLFFCTRVDVNRGHQAFMNSLYHRENILNPRYDQMGVGIYKGPDGSFWVTEMFLTTRSETVFAVSDMSGSIRAQDG